MQRVDEVQLALRDFGTRYLDRVYTASEQEALQTGGAASLAARFAAKEAVLKLIGDADGVDLRSVEITSAPSGRPVVVLSGHAAWLANHAGVGDIDVSLSHSGGLAVAVAVALVAGAEASHPSAPTSGGTADV